MSGDAPSKTSRHTPGPWVATSCLDCWVEHRQPITEADNGFRGVAHCGDLAWPNAQGRQAEWEANARLIAAAPTLLETMVDTRGGMLELVDLLTTEGWAETASAVVEQIRIIDAAIAKATGGAQ